MQEILKEKKSKKKENYFTAQRDQNIGTPHSKSYFTQCLLINMVNFFQYLNTKMLSKIIM